MIKVNAIVEGVSIKWENKGLEDEDYPIKGIITLPENSNLVEDYSLSLKELVEKYKGQAKAVHFTFIEQIPQDNGVEHSHWLTYLNKNVDNALELLSENGVIIANVEKLSSRFYKFIVNTILSDRNKLVDMEYLVKNNLTEHIIIYAKNNNEQDVKCSFEIENVE